jgi:hypothetical protein
MAPEIIAQILCPHCQNREVNLFLGGTALEMLGKECLTG